jgi:hypothetical protein
MPALISIGGIKTSVPKASNRPSSLSRSFTSKTAWVRPSGRGLQAILEDRLRRQEQPRAGEIDERVFELPVRRSQPLVNAQTATEFDEVVHLGLNVLDIDADIPEPGVHRFPPAMGIGRDYPSLLAGPRS